MQGFFDGLLGSIKQETGIIAMSYVAVLFIWGESIYAKSPGIIYASAAVVIFYVVAEKWRAIHWPKENGEGS